MSKPTNTPTAKTIKSRELKANVNKYILSAIDCEGYTNKGVGPNGELTEIPVVCNTDKEKVNFVMETFIAEYIHPNNRKEQREKLFADYLSGLPSCINIDYENYVILELAEHWGVLPFSAKERARERIINNWFNFIAMKFFILHRELNNKK